MHLQFHVDVTDSPDALLRVLTTLRRRGCAVTAVDYRAADRHRPARLDVGVATTSRTAHRLGPWLEQLVDVQGVDVASRRAL